MRSEGLLPLSCSSGGHEACGELRSSSCTIGRVRVALLFLHSRKSALSPLVLDGSPRIRRRPALHGSRQPGCASFSLPTLSTSGPILLDHAMSSACTCQSTRMHLAHACASVRTCTHVHAHTHMHLYQCTNAHEIKTKVPDCISVSHIAVHYYHTSRCIRVPHIAVHYITSRHTTSHYLTSRCIRVPHSLLHDITSHHITTSMHEHQSRYMEPHHMGFRSLDVYVQLCDTINE